LANLIREIRRRIRSVKNIAQVTKAMEAVSAAKMRKAQQQVLATRPYANQAREVLSYIARLNSTESELNPLINERPVKRTGILLITADRGLAGGFNANVLRRNAQLMREKRNDGAEVSVVAVGKKGREWLLRYDPVVRAEFTALPDNPTTYDIAPIVRFSRINWALRRSTLALKPPASPRSAVISKIPVRLTGRSLISGLSSLSVLFRRAM